jgi:hypothetical protein
MMVREEDEKEKNEGGMKRRGINLGVASSER